MALLKFISLIFKGLITLVVIFGFVLAVLNFMNVSFNLDGARQTIIKQIESYTERKTRIDGKVELTISFPPQLLVERIHISNIAGFDDEDFINLNEVKIEVPLLPLLSGQLHLGVITADQAKINLIQTSDDRHNWSFDKTEQITQPADTHSKKKERPQLSLGVFQLTNVAFTYRDESRDQLINKQLDRLIIDLKDRDRPQAEISGNVQGHPYTLKFESDALNSLTSGSPWWLRGSGHIAGSHTKIEASLQLIEQTFNASVDTDIKHVNIGLLLDKLGIISGQDFVTDNINIKTKIRGSDLTELYQQAEVSFRLDQGYWDLPSTETTERKKLSFHKATAFASWNKPVELHIDGHFAGEEIKLDFKTNQLLAFFDDINKLDIDLTSSIVDTSISLNGTLELPIKTRQFQLEIALKGRDLEKLNPIISSEFPAFNDFSLSGKLIANAKGYILRSAHASIGDSEMQAAIVIETNHPKPLWTISLTSNQIQLNDFSIDELLLQQPDTPGVKTSDWKNRQGPAFKPLQRLEEIVRAPKMHLNLNVVVNKVVSGEDILGKAHFQLHLRDDAISINNVDINIPGGRISSSTSLEIDGDEVTGNTTLDIDKFDYGIATRLFRPDSQVDGIVSARIDLQLDGSDFTRLLKNATGQIDFAFWPKNTRPVKALDLWATNLYLILLPELKKKESYVNCMVGLLNLDDGIMKEEFFAIDTTKLWIHGNITVDFSQEEVRLALFPRSKTARLFSLQSPIRVLGSFSEISLAINPVDLTGTYISFITSPLHVPTRWIFGDKIPTDASAICEQYFDREHVKNLKAKLQEEELKAIEEMLESD